MSNVIVETDKPAATAATEGSRKKAGKPATFVTAHAKRPVGVLNQQFECRAQQTAPDRALVG
jgi:hypothetical protein